MKLHPAPVEAGVIGYLQAGRAAHVGSRVPEARPEKFVRVGRTDGVRANIAQEAVTLLVECFAGSNPAAFELAASVWGDLDALNTSTALPWVHRVALTSPVNLEDPSTTQSRYQFLAEVTANLEVTA